MLTILFKNVVELSHTGSILQCVRVLACYSASRSVTVVRAVVSEGRARGGIFREGRWMGQLHCRKTAGSIRPLLGRVVVGLLLPTLNMEPSQYSGWRKTPPCPYCTLIFEESKLLLLAINKRSERAILDALSVGVLLFSVRT
jgi:hypothetical protein